MLAAHWHVLPTVVDELWETDPAQVLETVEILNLLGKAEAARQRRK